MAKHLGHLRTELRNTDIEVPLKSVYSEIQTYRSFTMRSPSPYLFKADGIYTSVRILLSELHESTRNQITSRSTINPRGKCLCFLISPPPSFLWLCESENSLKPGGVLQRAECTNINQSFFLKEDKKIQPLHELPKIEEVALLQDSPPNLFKCLLWKSPSKAAVFFFSLGFSSQWSLQS